MKSIQRDLTRAELDARVRDLRSQSWRRRPVAAIVAAALAASTVSPVAALAEPGGWDGGAPSSSTGGGGIGSDAGATGDGGYSGETSGYGSSTSSSPSDAADAAGPSSSSGGGGIGSDHAASANAGGEDSSPGDAAAAAGPSPGDSDAGDAAPVASEPQTGGLDPDSRDSVPDVAAAEDTSMPAVTAMGDATGFTQEITPATADTAPADPGSLPATTPMGDATGFTQDDVAPVDVAPAAPADPMPIDRPDGWSASVTATWGLGGTVGVGHDEEYTSVTIGTAEGTGFFGSAGEGRAAHQSTAGMSVKGGLGFVSGELGVDQTGVSVKGNLNMPANPGLNQTVASYTGKLDRNLGFSAYRTEGMSFGAQYGLATTQTVTIAIPNSAFETVANWLGIGRPSPNTGGGW